MTRLERIVTVFEGRRPDVVPWAGDLSYWYSAMQQPGRLPQRYVGRGVVDLYRDYGIGGMEQVLAITWRQTYDTDEITDNSWRSSAMASGCFTWSGRPPSAAYTVCNSMSTPPPRFQASVMRSGSYFTEAA